MLRFRGVPGGPKFSTRKLGVKFNDRALLGEYPLIQLSRLGEPHGPYVVWVKKYTLARFKSIRIVVLSVMRTLIVHRILRRKFRLCWKWFMVPLCLIVLFLS